MADPVVPEESLFVKALDFADPAARAAFLDAACQGRPDLRAEVDALLLAHAKSGDLLDVAGRADLAASAAASGEQVGVRIGPYKLLQRLGEGGMGTVFMAEQTHPVQRRVALKLIKPGMDSQAVLARFEAERQALALMDHPNIAKVHDAGATPSGRPYFAMELVKGVPITKYCDERHLTPRRRLELFVQVCQAVQHAHQKGVIHRDLKPSNVLVAEYDDRPVPKIIDFGVAKAAGPKLTERTLFTELGAVVGTLEYMSPEQAKLNALDVDTRSDVYSLGVILYELLTGTTPLDHKRLRQAAFDDMLRIIREEEPPKPSTRLSTTDELPSIAAMRSTEPKRLSGLIRGELDWIVMKALEKDRNRRYETANGLSLDLQRYLAGELVQACPPSAGYRLRKFVRRNKTAVVAAGLVLASLVLGIIGTSLGMWRAEHRRVEAEQAKSEAQTAKKIAEKAEAQTLAEFRASTDDAIQQLIGSKPQLGPREKAYLEKSLKRWQVFADRQGDDERSMAVRSEGHFRVGLLWAKLGRRPEARTEFEVARDLGTKLIAQYPAVPEYLRGLASTHVNLGAMLSGLGERSAARTAYEAACDLQKKLVAQHPDVPEYQCGLAFAHANFGLLLKELGERDAARQAHETARVLLKKLIAQYPAVPEYQHDLADNHNYLGALLKELGERDAARTEYKAARDLQTKLVAQHPADPEYQDDLAATHHNLGILLQGLGEREAARAEYKAARDLQMKLVAQYPAVPTYQSNLANTHNSLGILLRLAGERDAARQEFAAALVLQKKLVAQFPTVPEYQRDLGSTHNNLGILLEVLGEFDAARQEYEAALSLKKQLVAHYPGLPDYKIDLGASYCNLGILIWLQKPAESLESFDLAIATLEPVHRSDPRHVDAKQFLRNSYLQRAKAYDSLKKHAEAHKDWERAIELSSPAVQPSVRTSRAASRMQAGLVDEALAEVEELSQSLKTAVGLYDLACIYALASGKVAEKKQAYADRAMELLHQAVKAGYRNAANMKKDRDLKVLGDRDDFKKLIADLETKSK